MGKQNTFRKDEGPLGELMGDMIVLWQCLLRDFLSCCHLLNFSSLVIGANLPWL